MRRRVGIGDRKKNIKQQLNILIQLAKIDRDYDREEKEFIYDFGNKYNISRSEIEEIERNPEYFVNTNTFSLDEKIELMYNTLRLAKVDKRILPSEIIYCQEVASRLGFNRSVIDAMLPLVNKQPLELVNYTAIRRKVGPFL